MTLKTTLSVTDCNTMDYQFHQSQLSNAQKIYEAILNGHSYILFHLRMQGGKTVLI